MFRPYLHVERLGTDATSGLLDNDRVIVTAKVDGTSACAWTDSDGTLHSGSRNRELSEADDNAGFHAWLSRSDDDEARLLRGYLADHPSHIVYGEWMGVPGRFIGSMKDYVQSAHSRLFVFDVYDTSASVYLPDSQWRPMLADAGLGPWSVGVLATLDHPSEDDVLRVAEENRFLLPPDCPHAGEGVVCKADGFLDTYGQAVRGKLVLAEFREMKRKPKRAAAIGEVEYDIVGYYVTVAELAKTREKVVTACGAEAFDTRSPKMVGMMMSLVWKDLLGECPNWAKRFRNPVVDLSAMKAACDATVRNYLGLS